MSSTTNHDRRIAMLEDEVLRLKLREAFYAKSIRNLQVGFINLVSIIDGLVEQDLNATFEILGDSGSDSEVKSEHQEQARSDSSEGREDTERWPEHGAGCLSSFPCD